MCKYTYKKNMSSCNNLMQNSIFWKLGFDVLESSQNQDWLKIQCFQHDKIFYVLKNEATQIVCPKCKKNVQTKFQQAMKFCLDNNFQCTNVNSFDEFVENEFTLRCKCAFQHKEITWNVLESDKKNLSCIECLSDKKSDCCKSDEKNKICVPLFHKNVNFENDKQNKVVDKPVEKVNQSNVKMTHQDLVNVLKKRNRFEERYNQKPNYYEFIFIHKEDALFYERLLIDQHKEHHKACIKYEHIVNRVRNQTHQTVRSKICDHNFISKYPFLTQEETLIYSLVEFREINTNWTSDQIQFPIWSQSNAAATMSLKCIDLFETNDELKWMNAIVEKIHCLRKQIYNFFATKTMDNNIFDKTLKQLESLKLKMDAYMYDSLLTELLAASNNFETIDPVTVCTLIFAQNKNKDPFAVYFENQKYVSLFEKTDNSAIVVCHNSETLNLCLKTQNCELIELSKKASQKYLYFDSGVAVLFWRIVFYDFSFASFRLDKIPTRAFYCPYNMFRLEDDFCYGAPISSEQYYHDDKLFFVSESFGDVDFFELVLEKYKPITSSTFCGNLIRLYVTLSECGGFQTCNDFDSFQYISCIGKVTELFDCFQTTTNSEQIVYDLLNLKYV